MYAELLELARKVGHDAGALLMERPPAFEIESKSTAIDIATQMDKKAEKFIMESLLAARPDDGIIGEEGSSVASKSGITWVIDPLDGTVNYFYGLPGWNVSIAAKDKDGSVVGVITAPTINSTWWATRGGGAFYNGHQIHCNDPIALDRALIATGFQYDVAHRTTTDDRSCQASSTRSRHQTKWRSSGGSLPCRHGRTRWILRSRFEGMGLGGWGIGGN